MPAWKTRYFPRTLCGVKNLHHGTFQALFWRRPTAWNAPSLWPRALVVPVLSTGVRGLHAGTMCGWHLATLYTCRSRRTRALQGSTSIVRRRCGSATSRSPIFGWTHFAVAHPVWCLLWSTRMTTRMLRGHALSWTCTASTLWWLLPRDVRCLCRTGTPGNERQAAAWCTSRLTGGVCCCIRGMDNQDRDEVVADLRGSGRGAGDDAGYE